jgi:hypothetical protein
MYAVVDFPDGLEIQSMCKKLSQKSIPSFNIRGKLLGRSTRYLLSVASSPHLELTEDKIKN